MEIDSLFTLIDYPLTVEERDLIQRAYDFAKARHETQKRNSGEPYFVHVFAVAQNCARLGMDIETIVGGLLHDTLEDTDATEEEIREQFGENILFLVKGVTKLGKLKYRGQERHVESMRKFFVAMAEDLRVLIIKLADRLHNVQTLEHVRPDKRMRIAVETIAVHAALAGRLGMGKLKGMLEDYSFPYAYPKEYAQVKALFDQNMPEAQQIIQEVDGSMQKTLAEFSIKHATVDSRVKHLFSLYRKLQKYQMDIDRVYDIVALRVQVDTVADCYQVLGLVHMLWKPIPGRIKDYIALPKPNGYQSLHTTVVTEHGIVEIQIRTYTMNQEAEMGVASHFLYKENKFDKDSVPGNTSLEWLDELRELHTVVRNPSRFLEQLNHDLFKNRIFVFTPKGDVIDLPEDASPVDFSYAIHSRIGESTSSARVNGKMVPLGAKLRNGDIVEIITSKKAKPSSKWLDYAKTTLARRKIRAYVAEHGGLLQKFLAKE
ncbi:MAG: (p)ppGpp synthetase SpoT/RelA, pyrophosphokinae [Candidatus Nomurabacteria bacterium]|jgi:GTP pyrophosphokinase|nr:(p)ppGpp synthetase SpoT/RelA, pyrophosphokinae [Candidatus Nomurabacteria bacterium]